MIKMTRLNGQEVYVNADLILFLEKSPDTVVTLENGKKIMAREEIPVLIDRIAEFRARCYPTVVPEKPAG